MHIGRQESCGLHLLIEKQVVASDLELLMPADVIEHLATDEVLVDGHIAGSERSAFEVVPRIIWLH